MNWRKWLNILAATIVGLQILIFLVPTSVFIRPIEFQVEGRYYTFARELPFGNVEGIVHTEIRMPNGDECKSPWLPNDWNETNSNVIRAEIGQWAWPCVDRGEPYYINVTRRVLLFGFIPLWPQVMTTYVEPELGALPPDLRAEPLEED